MKKVTIGIIATICVCAVFVIVGQAVSTEEKSKDGLFIHVSHGADDPHRLLMAFKMATTLAEGGKPVLVYCDIKAVGALTKNAPDVAFDPFPSSKQQLDAMLKAGVLIRACPTCLKAAGLTEDDLIEGVKLANRDEFFSFTDGRILTLDY